MELIGIVGLLAWLALAAVCYRRQRVLWVLGAVLVPLAVFIVGLRVVKYAVFSGRDDGLEDIALAAVMAIMVIAITILSSFLVLAVGAIWPNATATPSKATKPDAVHDNDG